MFTVATKPEMVPSSLHTKNYFSDVYRYPGLLRVLFLSITSFNTLRAAGYFNQKTACIARYFNQNTLCIFRYFSQNTVHIVRYFNRNNVHSFLYFNQNTVHICVTSIKTLFALLVTSIKTMNTILFTSIKTLHTFCITSIKTLCTLLVIQTTSLVRPSNRLWFEHPNKVLLEYHLQTSPLQTFFQPTVTSFIVGPNIFVSTTVSNTPSLRLFLNVRYQVPHP
jgi:hypothetical protein